MPDGMSIPTLLFLAALMVTIGVLLYSSNRYFARQRSAPPSWTSGRPAAPHPDRPAEAPEEVQNWEVAMHDYARKVRGELDSKMSALQSLIAEADRAAARLERAVQNSRFVPGTVNQAGIVPPPAEPAASNSIPPRREEIYTLADYGLPPSEIAHRTGAPVGEVELILRLRGKK
jgi:hypothetical protein